MLIIRCIIAMELPCPNGEAIISAEDAFSRWCRAQDAPGIVQQNERCGLIAGEAIPPALLNSFSVAETEAQSACKMRKRHK